MGVGIRRGLSIGTVAQRIDRTAIPAWILAPPWPDDDLEAASIAERVCRDIRLSVGGECD